MTPRQRVEHVQAELKRLTGDITLSHAEAAALAADLERLDSCLKAIIAVAHTIEKLVLDEIELETMERKIAAIRAAEAKADERDQQSD
jgi:hypothetical protein